MDLIACAKKHLFDGISNALPENNKIVYQASSDFLDPDNFGAIVKKKEQRFQLLQVNTEFIFKIYDDLSNETYKMTKKNTLILHEVNKLVIPYDLQGYVLWDIGVIGDRVCLLVRNVSIDCYTLIVYNELQRFIFELRSLISKKDLPILSDNPIVCIGNRSSILLFQVGTCLYSCRKSLFVNAERERKLLANDVKYFGYGYNDSFYYVNGQGEVVHGNKSLEFPLRVTSIISINDFGFGMMMCFRCDLVYYVVDIIFDTPSEPKIDSIYYETKERILGAYVSFNFVYIIFEERYLIKRL